MKKPLICWRCGAAIKPEQRPISRLERWRACEADLHVCRLCRHYTTRLTGHILSQSDVGSGVLYFSRCTPAWTPTIGCRSQV